MPGRTGAEASAGEGTNRVAGTAIGGGAGGLLGNTIGGGTGRTVNESTQKLVGYDVTYRLEGKEGVVRMAFNPGSRIPVKDGQLVLTPPQAGR